MNLNDIWNTFQAIYSKAAPVFFVIIIVLPLIVLCFPKGSFKQFIRWISDKILNLNKNNKLNTFSELLNKFKLNVITPVIFIIASIWIFVMVSDIFDAVAIATINSSTKDLLIEQNSQYDLAVYSTMIAISLDSSKINSYISKESNLVLDTLKHYLLKNEKTNNKDSVIFSAIYNYYVSESYRLTNKYPERYGPIVYPYEMSMIKHRTRYGGFLVSALLVFILVVHPISKYIFLKVVDGISYFRLILIFLIVIILFFVLTQLWVLWFLIAAYVTLIILVYKNKTRREVKILWWRALCVFLILLALIIRYRLHYEWAYENESLVRSRISALTLQEEIHNFNLSDSLQVSLKNLKEGYKPEENRWMARYWDLIALKIFDRTSSYRPVKDNIHYWR